MAVAKISTPGVMRSNGVAKRSPVPVAVAPSTTTWPRTSSGSSVPATACQALKSLKLPRRSVEAQRQVIAEVERDRARPQLHLVGAEHRIGVERRRRGSEREGGNDRALILEQQRHVAGDAGAVGRDVGEPRLRRRAGKCSCGQRMLRRHRNEGVARSRCRHLVGIVAAEHGDGADHAAGRVERVGELAVGLGIAGIEQQDVDADDLRIVAGNAAHDLRQHAARQRKRAGLADGLLVDAGDDDAARRRARTGERIAPVEREIFERIERGSARRKMAQPEESAPGGPDQHEEDGERGSRRGTAERHHGPNRSSSSLTRAGPMASR